MSARLAKPVILLIGSIALFASGLTIDPHSPTCGSVLMSQGQLCQVQQRGAPRQRGYADLVHDATQARVVLLLTAGVLLLACGVTVAAYRRGTVAPVIAAERIPAAHLPIPRPPDPPVRRAASPRPLTPSPAANRETTPPGFQRNSFQRPSFQRPEPPTSPG